MNIQDDIQYIPKEKIYVQKDQNKILNDFQYKNKFKSAIIAFILFIVLSNKVSYKVLNIILTSFNNSIEVLNENEEPLILGTVILAFILGIVIFIF